jgi:hypothetical protein
MKKPTKIILIIIALLAIAWFLPVIPKRGGSYNSSCVTSAWVPGSPENEEEHMKSESDRCSDLNSSTLLVFMSLKDIYIENNN